MKTGDVSRSAAKTQNIQKTAANNDKNGFQVAARSGQRPLRAIQGPSVLDEHPDITQKGRPTVRPWLGSNKRSTTDPLSVLESSSRTNLESKPSTSSTTAGRDGTSASTTPRVVCTPRRGATGKSVRKSSLSSVLPPLPHAPMLATTTGAEEDNAPTAMMTGYRRPPSPRIPQEGGNVGSVGAGLRGGKAAISWLATSGRTTKNSPRTGEGVDVRRGGHARRSQPECTGGIDRVQLRVVVEDGCNIRLGPHRFLEIVVLHVDT